MAITAVGFNSQQVNEADWAKIHDRVEVVTGLDASVGVGTRAVAVSTGEATVRGTYTYSTSVVTVNAAANSTGANRRDAVILKLDWTQDLATIEIKTGTTSMPALTQNPGSVYEVLLADIVVANGATTISGGNIRIRKPLPRRSIVTELDLTLDEIFATSPGVTIGSAALTDPGWPYKVRVDARVRGRSKSGTPGGSFELNATVNGTAFARAVAPALAPSGAVGVPCVLNAVSPTQTAPATIAIVAAPNNLPAPGSFEIYGLADINHLTIEQFPV